ncbi:alanine racemase [Candidatus Berkelbacteria bacterium CG11_big_fil_rev_8_21_14_0_20_40_23]|nr:MAG: alanine racemase [Candidatus Berkelbacteria bacterium CG11_big_fil_rev_8_21_14_0_20_40_23]
MPTSQITINLKKLKANFAKIQDFVGNEVSIMPVIKSNGYGHGLEACAKALVEAGAKWFAVADLGEAEIVRKISRDVAVLILGPVAMSDYGRALSGGFRLMVAGKDGLNFLNTKAEIYGKRASVHLKINTGMNRFGIDPSRAVDYFETIEKLPNIYVEGVYTHLYNSDNLATTKMQWKKFSEVLFDLQRRGFEVPIRHLEASNAILNFDQGFFEIIRPGLLIYGLAGQKEICTEPVLSWKAKIVAIRRVKKGENISYNYFPAKKDLDLAIIGVGYADGYPRSLSGKAEILVSGKRCKTVGNINMNYTFVDISSAMRVSTKMSSQIGDEVILVGRDLVSESNDLPDEITVADLARWAETNEHEIVSRLPKEAERVYLD